MIDIPPGAVRAVTLPRGAHARIINRHGGQVVDTWAFSQTHHHEHLSMEHSRSATYRLLFKPGDTLMSNRFQPMLSIVKDTSPGIHDTLHAACSRGSNRFYGQPDSHPNCEDNLKTIMRSHGRVLQAIPCPWNLFEHAIVLDGNNLKDESASAKAGDYIELRAMMDLLLVCSACPSVVGKISGDIPNGAAIDMFEPPMGRRIDCEARTF